MQHLSRAGLSASKAAPQGPGDGGWGKGDRDRSPTPVPLSPGCFRKAADPEGCGTCTPVAPPVLGGHVVQSGQSLQQAVPIAGPPSSLLCSSHIRKLGCPGKRLLPIRLARAVGIRALCIHCGRQAECAVNMVIGILVFNKLVSKDGITDKKLKERAG
ncbi:hypothetical protein P7K49_026550 [Saguinus oedipus]|uniref:Uncharacterized protein n=1 Tax=Saguinus oedipus TaxID=9490 RepID=A0ABQ9UDJ6_SAGOE|nr:hypothetical protein P7K49_026550 [Saguinus oedipus]